MKALKIFLVSTTLMLCFQGLAQGLDIPSMMGGVAGNTNRSDDTFINSFSSSNVSGVTNPRISVYPNRYWNKTTNQPTPESIDNIVLEAHSQGQDLVLYFIHYLEADGDPGDYNKWYEIGRSFAMRFGKNSSWLASQGYAGKGSTTFMAFNEPWHNNKNWDPQVFKECMDGLGDGVHSVNPEFVVTPGGMPTYLLPDRNPLIGAITPLLNDGSLDGLAFHLYNDTRRDRPWRMDYEFNSQAVFDSVKAYWGITVDIYYHVTEYMPKADDEVWKSKYFLMHTWSNLGVVGNQGQPVTRHIAPYLYTITTPEHDQFSMADVDWLWQGNEKGRVYQMISRLTKGMQFVSLDPNTSGEFVLEGDGKKLVVWQNAESWTDHPGTSFTVNDIPSMATRLDVFRYNSWIQEHGGHGGVPDPYQSIILSGESSFTVNDLPVGECYMFMMYDGEGLNQHPQVLISNIQDNQVIQEGTPIEIIAQVSDVDSSIEEVRFFSGRSLLEVKYAPPYTVTLPGLPIGETQLIVTARDEHGGFNVGEVNVVVEPEGDFVRASDDAYVRGERNADINYGTEPVVEIRSNPNKLRDQYEGYLRFDLTETRNQSVDSAYLRLRINRKGVRNIDLHYVENDGWNENSLTWNNKPEPIIKIANFEPEEDGQWSKIDITSLVNSELEGDGVLSFMMIPQSPGLDTKISSKESSVYNAPFIELKRLPIAVEITSPQNNTDYPQESDIVINVQATDSTTTISKVEFFEDNNKLGETTSVPYTYTWQGVAAGNYFLTALATNQNGVQKRSEGVAVSVVDPDKRFLYPIEDTYVRGGRHSTENYGNLKELVVKRGGIHFRFESLLKFNLSDVNREVTQATLRLRVLEDDDRSGDPDHTLYLIDDSWQENTVTWDTKPATDSIIATQVAPDFDQWIEYDVTEQIKNEVLSDSLVSFLLQANNATSIIYHSKENEVFTVYPQLVVTMLPEPPSAPDNVLAATYSDTRIDLTWTDSSNEDEFIIERRSETDSIFHEVARLESDITYYSDIDLTCETTYTYRLIAYNAGGSSGFSNESDAVTRLCPNGQSPYGGQPWPVPGSIEAEDFDEGGEGVAYHDARPGNVNGQYRPSEGVDIQVTRDTGGGYNVGWTWKGEWLEYTIEVAEAGSYDIDVRVASWSRRGKFHIEFEGIDQTGSIHVPRTWGWQRWRTVSVNNVNLSVGKQIMRLYIDRGLFNINNIIINKSSGEGDLAGLSLQHKKDIDLPENIDFQIFPNPASDIITISGGDTGKLTVYSVSGKEIMQTDFKPGDEVNVSGLSAGIYVCKIQSNEDVTFQRIMKK